LILTLVGAASASASSDSTTFVPVGWATHAQISSDAATITKRLALLGYRAVQVEVTPNGIVVRRDSGNFPPEVLSTVMMNEDVLFRPVLCEAAPYAPHAGTPRHSSAVPVPVCAPAFADTPADVSVGADPQFAYYPNTSVDAANYRQRIVLAPVYEIATSADKTPRYVLGPTQMTSNAIAHAQASRDQTGQWVVNYRTTAGDGPLWDSVAKSSFHKLLAIELDGAVISAPLIEPTQSSFTSFDNEGEISGNLTKSEAKQLALAMNSGPLAVPLQVP
jgi:hypothetical protein